MGRVWDRLVQWSRRQVARQWGEWAVQPAQVAGAPAIEEANRRRDDWRRAVSAAATGARWPARDWREVLWEPQPSGTGAWGARVGNRVVSVAPVRGGGFEFNVIDEGGSRVWSEHTLGLEAARFLAVVHADPAYLDWERAAEVLCRFLNDCMDPDYVNQVNVETFGWDGLIADAVETGGLEGTATALTLADGTRLALMNGVWRVRRDA